MHATHGVTQTTDELRFGIFSLCYYIARKFNNTVSGTQ